MKYNQKHSWFTFVELIIVMIILVILSLISFVSFQSYLKWVRDAARVSNIKNIETSLDVYMTTEAKYPQPSNPIAITYSWSEVWQQWTLWDSIISQLSEFNEIPVDPLTELEYVYSRLNTKNEYQVATAHERDNISWQLWTSVYAEWQQLATAYVWGNYNGIAAKVVASWVTYLLAIPSIINADTSEKDLVNIINNKTLVYNWYYNIPETYKWTKLKILWGFNYSPASSIILYSWSELSTSTGAIQSFMINIQNTYSGSLFQNVSAINDILEVAPTNVDKLYEIWYSIILGL